MDAGCPLRTLSLTEPVELTSNTPSTSSSKSDSESSSSAAEVSETHKSGKLEFQYPVPVVLSDSEDDAVTVSPSQHKLAMAK